MSVVYKIVDRHAWAEAERIGRFAGAAIDRTDGFIHFSAANQLRETAAKHFGGQDDLVLVAVETETLGSALRWEVSRGGALFPHLYGLLPLSAVVFAEPLPLDAEGRHQFSPRVPC